MKHAKETEQIRIAGSGSKRARFRDFRWRLSYRASVALPTDLLHDFYVPALRCAIGYDRMAGCFCPASLAAASQGLSGFIRRQGRIRLVVGTNLEPDEIHICLAEESQAQLSARLRRELQHPDKWPLDVQRGVRLLAWMVNKGQVEIRLAFRTHLRTGKLLQFDSTEDGLAPSKWAVLTDASGDRILVSGRLNESRTAPIRNAENIDVHCDWWNEEARQRVDAAEQEFRALWEDRHEAFRVVPLPLEVRDFLASFATEKRARELDGTLSVPLEVPEPSPLEWLTFALIKDAPQLPGGKYVGMETAAVEPWPHQRIVARRLIDHWPYSFLLCDEVGLGKTIESGLAIRSLHLSGYLERILIAAPAHLVPQWQREMAQKFFLPFARALPGASVRHAWLLPLQQETDSASLYEHPLTIVSTGLMARAGRREDLERSAGFDLALLDEAHCARRSNPTQGTAGHARYNQLYLLTEKVIRPKARSLVLATATPMQLHEVEAADLMRLTRRAGAFLYDPSLTFSYYELLSRLQRGRKLGEPEWRFLHRCVRAIEEQDPAQWKHIRATVISGAHEPEIQRWLEHPTGALSPLGMEGVRRLLFAAAPLSRTMLRHTRALLDEYRTRGELKSKLPRRTLLPIPAIHFTAQEQAVYDRLGDYCAELAQRLAGAGAMRTAIGFFLSFLQLRFASSLYAIRCTLERRHDKVARSLALFANPPAQSGDEDLEQVLSESDEGDEGIASAMLHGRAPADLVWEKLELESILEQLRDLSATPSKLEVLLQVLHSRTARATGRVRQTIIFTRFVDTLTDLAQRLMAASSSMRLGCYSGPGCRYRVPDAVGWVSCSRDDINRRFLRGEIDVLLCTDAAAEGLNLQTADLLVNYDLPWNPMTVEQRIGRIDRIGQRHEEIQVLNLCYPDSAEQLVYGRLLSRLEGIMGTVGRQNLSLLPVLPEEFEALAAGTLSFEALENRVRERLKELERRNAAFDIPAGEQYEMYSRLASHDLGPPLPVTLAGVFEALTQSTYLKALGCVVQDLGEAKVLRIANVPGVSDGAALTVSRSLYERGSADFEGELHFATWGEPAFDAVVAAVLAHKPPGCIRKIEVAVPASRARLAGYAVATPGGVKLAKSIADLVGLQLDPDAQPSQAELPALSSELKALAQRDGQACALADWVETANEEAGRTERALHCFAAASLLEQIADGKGSLFRSAMTALQTQLDDRVLVRIPHIPYQAMRGHLGLLFEVSPSLSHPDHFHVDLPRFMLDVIYDTARREAESLRVGHEHLTVDQVVERLKREAEHALGETG
jgi:superfamily II DNA or RNA helicase